MPRRSRENQIEIEVVAETSFENKKAVLLCRGTAFFIWQCRILIKSVGDEVVNQRGHTLVDGTFKQCIILGICVY